MVQIDQSQLTAIDDRVIEIDQRLQYLMDLAMRHGSSDWIAQEKETLEFEKANLYLKKETLLMDPTASKKKVPQVKLTIAKWSIIKAPRAKKDPKIKKEPKAKAKK